MASERDALDLAANLRLNGREWLDWWLMMGGNTLAIVTVGEVITLGLIQQIGQRVL